MSSPTPLTGTPIPPSTVYPSTLGYVFGIPTPEAGITLETYEQNDQVDIFEQRNELNAVVEVITNNPRSEITLNGQTTAAIAQILGKNVTVANLIQTQMGTVGLVVCIGVNYSNRRDQNQSCRISARHYPLISPGTGAIPVNLGAAAA